jgi:hypothetical protein
MFLAASLAALTLFAQDRPASSAKKSSSKASASKTSKSKPKSKSTKKTSSRSKRKTLTPAQRAALARHAARAHRAFVASSDLRPMAQQLLEARTPPAYAGVEAYARKHAKEDAGALAYLVLGYAHFLDHDFAKAIPDLKRAQLNANEIDDYSDYFLATCYFSTNAPDSAHHILADFATRHPESILQRDAELLDANVLLTMGQSKQVIARLEPYRQPYRPDVELLIGRALLRSGDTTKGADVLRRIYYTAPASPQADAAALDLKPVAGLPQALRSPIAPGAPPFCSMPSVTATPSTSTARCSPARSRKTSMSWSSTGRKRCITPAIRAPRARRSSRFPTPPAKPPPAATITWSRSRAPTETRTGSTKSSTA